MGSITEYFCSVLASDGSHNRGALKDGNLLFRDHYVHSINIYKQYTKRTISAKCRAQMKKSTTYQINMIISTNRPADIPEGTCECVAGSGPRAAYHVYLLRSQISNLEQITRGQSSSDQWSEARKLRISIQMYTA
ncbi:unnamed protein product [Adineta steineri]|uniref:Uncharacterized protein n=1 Tax=Adineta steineri TaxID=433720 RepID=A0A819X1T6_9BILA|nr:unnamed protein product [Adineta steineri]CAF4135257.1 unnamed protein product [Adineta steineri]